MSQMGGGMGVPRIPGLGINKPGGNQFQVKLDIMALPNAKCVKCDCEFFIARSNIKMISPMQSPDGQWAHGVAQWWSCQNCGYKFDPKEWVDKRDADIKKDAAADK